MDVYNADNYNGVNVIQWRSNGGDNQKWKIVKTSDGYYSFISKCNGLYLDMNGGVPSNEVNIQCYQGNSTVAQKFVLQSVNYKGSAYQDSSTTSSNKIQALIAYETSQIGTGDVGGNNNVECNRWFYYDRTINGSGYPWCQTFQSWCAYKVGISETVIPKTAYCPTAVNWFKNKQEFHLSNYYGGNYTPKAGDLVYYGANGGDHVGLIIASPVGGYLQVIEGNVRDDATGNYTVQKFTANRKRRVDSSYVYGYASPQYQ